MIKRGKWQPYYLFVTLASFWISLAFASPSFAQGKVTVEVGPEFKPSDGAVIASCYTAHFANRFPIGILGTPPVPGSASDACPHLRIFKNEFKFCEVLDIWGLIRPGVLIMLFYQAIIVL